MNTASRPVAAIILLLLGTCVSYQTDTLAQWIPARTKDPNRSRSAIHGSRRFTVPNINTVLQIVGLVTAITVEFCSVLHG